MRRKAFDTLLTTGGLVVAALLLVAGTLPTWGNGFIDAQIAMYGAWAAFAGAFVMMVLSGLGFRHLRHTRPEEEVLAGRARKVTPATA